VLGISKSFDRIEVDPVHFEAELSIVVAGIRCQVKRIAEDGCSIDPNLAAEIDRIATEFSDGQLPTIDRSSPHPIDL
jgi:hypothetical protein